MTIPMWIMWCLPAFIFVASFVWASGGKPQGDYDSFTPIVGLLKVAAGIILTLGAYLAIALCRSHCP